MIGRYEESRIAQIFCDENKLELWEIVELSIIKARADLNRIPMDVYLSITQGLRENPISQEVIAMWLEIERELNHDLNAFVQTRRRVISVVHQGSWHDEVTSFDIEEPAFALMLKAAVDTVISMLEKLMGVVADLAKRYRYTVMLGVTHGQAAELQSFGKRCLTWLVQLRLGLGRLREARELLNFSKISGTIGNYSGVNPELEKWALGILGLKPFYGATQIMPRAIYLPVAQALCQITQEIDKISTDIRLAARSVSPIMQEPFGKKATGSSAMPQKKNTIGTEKNEGMSRMALGFLLMIELNLKTWEERAIEQSSVERVAWPDLFHVTCHSITTLTKILSGLKVYPDNMIREIENTHGCYAAAAAKNLLTKYCAQAGISADEVYRIVQLASFNMFEPKNTALAALRTNPPQSLAEADVHATHMHRHPIEPNDSIRFLIPDGALRLCSELSATQEDVDRWNIWLEKLFCSLEVFGEWEKIFTFSHALRDEATLFKEILDV